MIVDIQRRIHTYGPVAITRRPQGRYAEKFQVDSPRTWVLTWFFSVSKMQYMMFGAEPDRVNQMILGKTKLGIGWGHKNVVKFEGHGPELTVEFIPDKKDIPSASLRAIGMANYLLMQKMYARGRRLYLEHLTPGPRRP